MRISCAEILEVGKDFFVASSVKKMSRFEEVLPEKSKRIFENLLKQLFFSDLPDMSLVGYIYQLISGLSSKNNC